MGYDSRLLPFLAAAINLQPSSTEVKEEDLQFSLEDLEAIKVIGKGSGGVVQLVQHKWVGTLYALKVVTSHNTTLLYSESCFLLYGFIILWLQGIN